MIERTINYRNKEIAEPCKECIVRACCNKVCDRNYIFLFDTTVHPGDVVDIYFNNSHIEGYVQI